jgi:serine/threonine-protein kinase
MLELVGRGGMGKVYRARQTALGRIVAVKLLVSEPDEKSLSRFREEYRAVARLQHPNIAQLFESGISEGRPFFTQEFIEGGTLASKYGGVPQDAHEAARTVEIISRAIHYSHEQGILHRDLKPGNILLTGRGEPKVTDFGLAKDLAASSGDTPQESGGGLTRTGEILGTPSYMPPEQASGVVSGIDARADVYSLGAILYEALTGRPPFQGPDPLQTLFMVLSMEPVAPSTLLPKLPRDVETICLKCLEKSPRKRYPTAAELADDLKRFLNREPIHARPVGRVEGLQKWAGRNKPAAALIGLSAVFVVALIAFAIVQVVQSNRIKNANQKLALTNRNLEVEQAKTLAANEGLVKAKNESDASFNLARSSLDDIVRNLALQLSGVPKADTALFETLRRSAELYRQLNEIRPEDPANAERYAASLTYLSSYETSHGDYASARKTLDKLEAFLDAELAKQPENEKLHTERVRLAHDRMNTAQSETPPTNAPAARKKFMALADAYAAKFPAKPESRTFTVQKFIVVSNEANAKGDHAARIAALKEGLAVAKKYVEDFPTLPSGYTYVGTVLYVMGMAHVDKQENDEADKCFTELEQYYMLAIKVDLGNEVRLGGIALAKLERGNIAYNRAKFQDAYDLYKAAEGLYRKLATDYPLTSIFRINLAYALFWGGFLLKNSDREACLKKVDEAIELMEDVAKKEPDSVSHKATLETYRTGRKGLTQ